VLDIVEGLVHDPLVAMNATVAAVFRSLGIDHPPTLIVDEVDTIFGSKRVAENNEDLRGLLNAGFQRGKDALRCVGPSKPPPCSRPSAWPRSQASEDCRTPSLTAA
jgi:hypothetical protein